MQTVIEAKKLSMSFKVPVRETGIGSSISSIWRRHYREVDAVKSVRFSLGRGEIVGFLGPNGAGKTTTLKLLSGILHPTSGTAEVLGCVPWRRTRDYLKRVAMIRGSRPLSVPGELTVMDAIRFQQRIYEVEQPAFKRQLADLCDMLSISHLLDRPVRVLSLGERMRAGLACSLIYYPQVLFLDEPTIGLDVSAITMMRQFIADYTAQSGATVVLTSHYMADVQSLCKRVILINEGSVTFDGSLQSLGDGLVSYKMIRVPTERISAADLSESEKSMLMSTDNGMLTFRVPKERIAATASRLLTKYGVDDISIEEPPLELLMDQIYREGI